ncbi:hypothetical protein N9030_00180 [bacterium]|nr:hypothetical protein [bacterium]
MSRFSVEFLESMVGRIPQIQFRLLAPNLASQSSRLVSLHCLPEFVGSNAH